MFREFRQQFLPYCLHKLKDGRYMVLNREYKPLGYPMGDFIDYEGHPSAVNLRISVTSAKKLSYKGSPDKVDIYLYNDGCTPLRHNDQHTQAYFERLRRLSGLQLNGGSFISVLKRGLRPQSKRGW